MKKKNLILLGVFAISPFAYSQVGIKTTTPHKSADLELASDNKALLLNRVQADPGTNNPILESNETTPVHNNYIDGMLVYDETNKCVRAREAGVWSKCLSGKISGEPSSGGTGKATWTDPSACRIGAGTNNSPAGVQQFGVNQTMFVSIPATGTTITLTANVTQVGTYHLETNTVNGVKFTGSGTFASLGNQTVTLTATGTPIAAGNFEWALNADSKKIFGSVITRQGALGSSFTNHYNGIVGGVSVDKTLVTYTSGETFNNNTLCTNAYISAGYNATSCSGAVTVGANTYDLVHINGQCWMKKNLNEVPALYSHYTTSSWTNTTPSDQGYWGYYHTTDVTGASGWGTSMPANNPSVLPGTPSNAEGLLYQWCAATEGTKSERTQGVCPLGYHIPSDCEWMYLEHGLGMPIAQQIILTGWRDDASTSQGEVGKKIKAQGSVATTTNASGFSAVVPGFRVTNGTYSARGSNAHIWSSTVSSNTSVYGRALASPYTGVNHLNHNKAHGFQLRCLRD